MDIFNNERKNMKKKMVWLSALLLLSVLLKPSFYQFFAICGALFTVIYFLREFSIERFKLCVGMDLAFIPATIWTIYGMINNVNPLEFQPFTSILINNNGILESIISIIQGILFCILVSVIFMKKKEFSAELKFVWGCFMVALLEFCLLIEPAEIGSLNMSWGYMNAMYILFAYCLVKFERLRCETKISKVTYIIGNSIFIWHVSIGIYAFLHWADNYRLFM